MTEGTEYRTRSGKVLSDADIEAMAAKHNGVMTWRRSAGGHVGVAVP
jgi:hypothetical protein